MENNKNQGIIVSGNGKIQGNNIVVGPKSQLNHHYFSSKDDTQFEELSKELDKLSKYLYANANSSEKKVAIGKVAEAEIGCKEKDENKVIKFLNEAGKWVWETAESIGLKIVTELINKEVGL